MVFGPIGGRIEIQGLQSFRAAKNEVVNGFNQINKAVKSVGTTTLPSLTGGARGGLYTGGRIGGIGVYQRLPVQLGLIGVAAGGAIAVVEKLGATFDKTTNAVRVFGNATEAQTEQISKASINMSRSFVSSANEISQGAIALGKAGAPVADLSNNLLEATVIFNQASQGEVSTAEASDLLVQSVQALNLTYDDSIKLVDTYVGAVQNSTLTFGDLTTQLKTTLPIAGALNITAEELATTLALLSQNGLRGSIAGTTLKNALLAIADPSKEALELLKKYNISLFDAQGKALPLIEVLGRLEAAFGKTNEGISDAQKFFEQADIFNTRQILAALALVNQGTSSFERMQTAIRNTSSAQIAQELQNNVIDQLKIVGNNLAANALIAANEFQPTITRALQLINTGLRGSGEEARSFGRALNEVLSLNNEEFNGVITNLAGVVGGLQEAVTITKELFAELVVAANDTELKVVKSIDNIKTGIKEVPKAAEESFPAARKELADLGAEFSKTDDLVGVVVKNMVEKMDFLGRVAVSLMGGTTKTIAGETTSQVGIVDAAIAQVIDILNAGIRAINAFLGAVGILTKNVGMNDMLRADPVGAAFPDVAALANQAKRDVQEAGTFITGVTENVLTSIAAGYEGAVAIVEKTSDRIGDASRAASARAKEDIKEIKKELLPNMPNDMGFWDHIAQGVVPATIPRITGGGGSTFPSAGGGGGSGAEDVDKLAARIREMLSDVPALTQELTEFIAGIAKDFPERLQPMVAALKASRGEVGQLVLLKRDMLQVDLQLIGSEQKISALEAESGRLDIQQALAVIGYDKQLLGLRQQLLEIDNRMNPLRDALLTIEREMARLQQENLGLARQRIELEIQMLPLRSQIEAIDRRIAETQRVDYDTAINRLNIEMEMLAPRKELAAIDRQMADLQRKNFDIERERINLELQALPIAKRIRDIEDAITETIDKRANIQKQLRSLDLADIEDDLTAAWERMDVPAILALEERKRVTEETLKGNEKEERAQERIRLGLELQKVGLEEQLSPIEKRLQGINDTTTAQGLLNEITLLGLEEQRVAIELVLRDLQDKIDTIDGETEKQRILNEIIRLGLEKEKQLILDLLEPLETKLAAINAEISAENLRNQLLITHLEEERRKIIEQLQPLEDERRAIERITQEVDLLRARAALEFEERKIGIAEMILNEKLRQAELLETKRQQNLLFQDLVLGYVNSLEASGAFTLDEALEVAQRLRLWNEQIAKLAETVVEFQRLDRAAEDAAGAIRSIERDVTVTITTVHRSVYESSGAAPSGEGVPQFARGGVVPGPRGQPMLAIVHGGEVINSVTNNRVPDVVRAREAAFSRGRGDVTIYETNYNVDANYANTQSPASLRMDLSAVVAMAAR